MLHRSVVLAVRPRGPIGDDTFRLVETERPTELDAGQIRIATRWLSCDPAQRGSLNDLPSYRPPVQVGEIMHSQGIGEVVASASDRLDVGDLVVGQLGWQDWLIVDPADAAIELERIDPIIDPPTLALHVLGLTGLTAYVGLTQIGGVQPGDTVLVTAAAGATGSVAGQVARLLGAGRVIGTAGSPEKRAWVTDVAGFDDCVDHYDTKVFSALRAAAPDGFDVVFDNVGGELLDSALGNLALHARVVLCGSISTGYAPRRPEIGLRNYQFLTTRRSRMEGFIVLDHHDRFAEARQVLQQWAASQQLRWQEDVVEGLERAPEALQRLFDGKNIGKQLVRVDGH